MSDSSGSLSTQSPDLTLSPLEDVSLDTVYGLLSNHRRRLVLHYLVDAPANRATVGDLATQLAAWENDEPVASVTSRERKRTYNTLQQTHLPKLAEAGVVDYDRNRGTVVLESDPRHLRIFLEFLPKTGTPLLRRVVLVEAVVWVLLAVKWSSVHLFGVLSPTFASMFLPTVLVVMLALNAVLLYYFW